jgi:hypothetical protein
MEEVYYFAEKHYFDFEFEFFYFFLKLYQGRIIYSLRVRDGIRSLRTPSNNVFNIPYYDMKSIIIHVYVDI